LVPYYPIFLYLIAVVGFVVANLILTHLVGPSRKTPVKMMPYESGMDPIGDARQRFEPGRIDATIVSNETNRGALRARHRPRLVTHLLNDTDDALDVFRRRVVLHDD